MGWLSVLICIIAATTMRTKGHTIFMIVAIIAAIVCFWSWGVMHNYANERAKRRRSYQGDFTAEEVQSVPDWITWINMGFTILGITILVGGIVAH